MSRAHRCLAGLGGTTCGGYAGGGDRTWCHPAKPGDRGSLWRSPAGGVLGGETDDKIQPCRGCGRGRTALLEAISDTFRGVRDPPLTPSEVRDKEFRTTTRWRPGYDQEEVDAFLDEAERRLIARQRGAMDDAD